MQIGRLQSSQTDAATVVDELRQQTSAARAALLSSLQLDGELRPYASSAGTLCMLVFGMLAVSSSNFNETRLDLLLKAYQEHPGCKGL